MIEMLAVVAIISVLVALLLPVVVKVRTQARTIRCLGNLRQVGQALGAYGADYKMVVPNGAWWRYWTPGTGPSTPDPGQDHLLLWRMLQGQYGGPIYVRPSNNLVKYPDNPILFCPNNGVLNKSVGWYAMYSADPSTSRKPEAGSFTCPTLPLTPYPGFQKFIGLRLSAKGNGNSADLFLVGCSSIISYDSGTFHPYTGYYSFASFHGTNTGGTPDASLWAAHSNRVNGLFADWHVETCDKGRLLGCSNLNGNTVAGGWPSDRPTGISYWRNEDFKSDSNY